MERGYILKFKIIIEGGQDLSFKDVYNKEELKILLKKPALKKCSFYEYRTWVITNFLLATAIRLNTLANIKIKDIDFSSGQICLKTLKNKTPFCIPLSRSLEMILKEYLKIRGGTPNDFLFCNEYGKPLKKSAIQSSIRRYNLKRGIFKTSIHLYRHTFVKYWLLDEGNIYELQRILGHKTLNMVVQYANYYGVDLKKNFDKHSILENYIYKGEKIKLT